MLTQRDDGSAVRVAPLGDGYRGPLHPASVLALRRLLARSLTGLGLSGVQVGQVVNASPSTVCEMVKLDEADDEPEFLPPDEPPMIEPPAPYRRPAVVEVSAEFIRKLREDYRAGDDGRAGRIGQLSDVQEWLAGLKPGLGRDRADRPPHP
jgi:hypothetical protein